MNNLPPDILEQIYLYDDTHRQNYDKVLLQMIVKKRKEKLIMQLIDLLGEYFLLNGHLDIFDIDN
jgi:hypothetical protein